MATDPTDDVIMKNLIDPDMIAEAQDMAFDAAMYGCAFRLVSVINNDGRITINRQRLTRDQVENLMAMEST